MSDLRQKPIPVPRGGFCTHEDEAKWLADTIAMRTSEGLAALGLPSFSVPTASLYELLLLGLQNAAKRAGERSRKLEALLAACLDAQANGHPLPEAVDAATLAAEHAA